MTRYPDIDLREAVVVVTGGARGIGLATATAFAAEGASVCLGDLDGPLAVSCAKIISGYAPPST